MSVRVTKALAVAILAVSWAALAAGCVTVGYDFVRQQATVTFDPKTVKEPTK
jgi:hypothetical protein